ncbi:hypothetical protein EXN66_Car006668 [Channa argus]|uniref:Uncharacterized protein n=1 Tax=Channa argus TaxID=215402 RepID=A0A6G1PLH2_CHAAH|nr:hypothetical protein EXN66_Car006668 [Channa argus]
MRLVMRMQKGRKMRMRTEMWWSQVVVVVVGPVVHGVLAVVDVAALTGRPASSFSAVICGQREDTLGVCGGVVCFLLKRYLFCVVQLS